MKYLKALGKRRNKWHQTIPGRFFWKRRKVDLSVPENLGKMEYQSSYTSKQRTKWIYMICKDNTNEVSFGKSGATPISNETVGRGDAKWCTKINSKRTWIPAKQIAAGTLKLTTTVTLREQTPNNWIIFTTYQYQKEDESTRKI